MAPKSLQTRYETLLAEVKHHRDLYHTHDAPEISDEVYDSLVKELQVIEYKYPELKAYDTPSESIGADVSEAFSKVQHAVRQYSFDNVFTSEELRAWDERVRKGVEKEGGKASDVAYCME